MSEALVSTLAAPRKRMEKYLSRALESQEPTRFFRGLGAWVKRRGGSRGSRS